MHCLSGHISRRVVGFGLGLAVWFGLCGAGWAMYMRPDIEQVPVARLVQNLEARLKDNPTDAQTMFNLARLHAMAYALKSDTAQVLKKREEKGSLVRLRATARPLCRQADPTMPSFRLRPSSN